MLLGCTGLAACNTLAEAKSPAQVPQSHLVVSVFRHKATFLLVLLVRNESALRSPHGSSGPDSHSHLHSRQQIHRGAARVKAEKVMAPFALDVRYGPRKFRIACRGPTTVARARRAICRRARVEAATLRTAERALGDAEVIESAATLVLVDSRSKLPPTCAAQALQHYRVAYALVFVRAAPDVSATVVGRRLQGDLLRATPAADNWVRVDGGFMMLEKPDLGRLLEPLSADEFEAASAAADARAGRRSGRGRAARDRGISRARVRRGASDRGARRRRRRAPRADSGRRPATDRRGRDDAHPPPGFSGDRRRARGQRCVRRGGRVRRVVAARRRIARERLCCCGGRLGRRRRARRAP